MGERQNTAKVKKAKRNVEPGQCPSCKELDEKLNRITCRYSLTFLISSEPQTITHSSQQLNVKRLLEHGEKVSGRRASVQAPLRDDGRTGGAKSLPSTLPFVQINNLSGIYLVNSLHLISLNKDNYMFLQQI